MNADTICDIQICMSERYINISIKYDSSYNDSQIIYLVNQS